MKTLAIVSQKGGVGKTTLATALAVAFEQAGVTTALFDLDDQASASFWSDLRKAETPVVRDVKVGRLQHYLGLAEANGCDLVIIDCPPVHRDVAMSAAEPSDFVLIPTRADILDIRAMRETVALMQTIRKKCGVVLTFCPPSGSEVAEARDLVKQIGAELVPVEIHQRKAFSRAQQDGLAVQEYEPDGKAAEELLTLHTYVSTALGLNNGKKLRTRKRA